MKVLAVIDMQNDFISGPLGTEEAAGIVGKVREKIEACERAGRLVVFTRDTHSEGYLHTQEGRRLPVPHCVRGTHGWQIAEELPTAGHALIDKPAFGSLRLAQYIWKLDNRIKEGRGGQPDLIEEIELVGLCTDICVISNALLLKAFFPELPVSVTASLCAGVTPESHENALKAMKMCQIEVRQE